MIAFDKYKSTLGLCVFLMLVGIMVCDAFCFPVYIGLIPGFLLLLWTLSAMSKLKRLLSNGIYTKATIVEIEEKTFSKIFHCVFHTIDNNLIEVEYKNADVNANHLCVGSIVPILYQKQYPEDIVFCPEWGVWKRKHLLDFYLSNTEQKSQKKNKEEFPKQREIDFYTFLGWKWIGFWIFAIILVIINILVVVTLLSLMKQQSPTSRMSEIFWITGGVLSVFICFCILYGTKNAMINSHTFYEYYIKAQGVITEKHVIIHHNRTGKVTTTSKRYEFKYTFSTPNNIPYCGSMEIPSQSVKFDINQYNENTPVTILYDSCNIGVNYLAVQYPEYLKLEAERERIL